MADKPSTPATEKTVVKLKRPIEFAGRKITQVELRRPKAKDSISTRRAYPADVDFQLHLIASLAEIEPEALQEMDMADYTAIGTAVNDFLS
jgi:hypothetical protein